jgi:hypothetical protein
MCAHHWSVSSSPSARTATNGRKSAYLYVPINSHGNSYLHAHPLSASVRGTNGCKWLPVRRQALATWRAPLISSTRPRIPPRSGQTARRGRESWHRSAQESAQSRVYVWVHVSQQTTAAPEHAVTGDRLNAEIPRMPRLRGRSRALGSVDRPPWQTALPPINAAWKFGPCITSFSFWVTPRRREHGTGS